ncbi:beta-1,3-galactosyltransferase 2-like [Salminus brasiliensis]|uniref:beta-1,3-galactosyltransferase 2-like n=1 Tax=Salminus brasiliensis TaxID=930266 RepID=UPI003B82F686
MQWRRRHCRMNIAGFLLLLCVGVYLMFRFMFQYRLLAGKEGHQEKSVMHTSPSLQPHRLELDFSTTNLSTLREPAASTMLPMSEANLSSSVRDSSQQGLESSKVFKPILVEEMSSETVRKVEPYNYIVNEAEKCQEADPFLVLLITVRPDYVEARDAIRQTWGNESIAGGLGLVRLFLLGVAEGNQGLDSQLQRSIAVESQQYHDIIQQDYIDSYNNLTIKTMMGMHWVATYCPGASYVMKTDCDMFVNTEYLIHKLLNPSVPPRRKYFTGHLIKDNSPIRNKDSKWYMSPKLYATEWYPTFCSGTGYVFSGDMAHMIYGTSLRIRRLHLEDVYVGLCLAKLRVEPVPPPEKSMFNHWRISYSSCKYSRLITSHGLLPTEIIKYWNDLQRNKHNTCVSGSG